MGCVPVTMITNTTNRGFPAAINQGMKAARGEYLVLLNSDAEIRPTNPRRVPFGLTTQRAVSAVRKQTVPDTRVGRDGRSDQSE
jgi:glycosyltransferase involved in cell wall biosynthesis